MSASLALPTPLPPQATWHRVPAPAAGSGHSALEAKDPPWAGLAQEGHGLRVCPQCLVSGSRTGRTRTLTASWTTRTRSRSSAGPSSRWPR